MSDLEPRRRSAGVSRRQRESRAYSLVVATGALGLVTVVLLVLAVLGVASFGYAFLAALLTAGGGFLLRRTLSS